MESKKKYSTPSKENGNCNTIDRLLTLKKSSRLNQFLDELFTSAELHKPRYAFLETIQNYQRLPKITTTSNNSIINQGMNNNNNGRDPKQSQSLDLAIAKMLPHVKDMHSNKILPPLQRQNVVENVLKDSLQRRIRRLTADIAGNTKSEQPTINCESDKNDNSSRFSVTNTSKMATDNIVVNKLADDKLLESSNKSCLSNDRKSTKNFLKTIKEYKEQRRKVG